jgi:hypothetical protein
MNRLINMIDEYTDEYVRYIHISGDLPDDDKLSAEINGHIEELYMLIHDQVDLMLQSIVKDKLK